jgi:hypothetical protein
MLQGDVTLVAQVVVGTVKAPVALGRARLRREVARVPAHAQGPTTDVEEEGLGLEVTQESVTGCKTYGGPG